MDSFSFGRNRLRSSPGSRLRRVRFDGRLAVAKRLIGPDAAQRYERELAALTAAGAPLVPAVLATDPRRNLIVLEHLEFRPGVPPWPEFAASLARLHAVGGAELPPVRRPGADDAEAFLRLCHGMDVSVRPAAEAELSGVLDVLAAQPADSLVHGDPCLGNVLACPDGVRFVDFEQAGNGCGIAELAFLRIGFPTCGMAYRLDEAEIAEAEAAYLDAAGRASADTVAEHCVGWLIRGDMLVQRRLRGARDQFARLTAQDWNWGPETARQRLAHRLGVVAGFADRLPAVAQLAGSLRDNMIGQWPEIARSPRHER